MSSWAQRIHNVGSVVTSCTHNTAGPYPHRLEKVKFGVSLAEVCKSDIPGPLLVLILKINKEAPQRKDVFRAPGNQNAMKKLIHFLQAGRLVNVSNYSVYTIAMEFSDEKGKLNSEIIHIDDQIIQQERIHRLIISLPVYTQRLLVLLFGTFRVIATNSDRGQTGMTSEALGVSVAPSFFQSCVSDGKNARMEDVLRFKVATQIMKQMIDQFAVYDLFGRENYEYYARVTGRVLRVQDEWICGFQYPPPPRGKSAQQNYALKLSLEAEKTWLQCECDRWRLSEESQSTPALLTGTDSNIGCSAISLSMIPEHNTLLESCARLSVSLEGPSLFAVQSTQSRSSSSHSSHSSQHMTMDELRAVNRYAESTKSLSYLPQVRLHELHERQTARMRTRSEWFLSGGDRVESLDVSNDMHLRPPIGHPGMGTYRSQDDLTRYLGNIGLISTSAESVHQAKRPSRRIPRHHPHRSSSRRNKENGSRSNSFRNNKLSNNEDEGRGRKARAVSFEQPPIVIVTSHQEWCKYSISVDDMDDQPNLSITDCVDGIELMDTSPSIEQHQNVKKYFHSLGGLKWLIRQDCENIFLHFFFHLMKLIYLINCKTIGKQ